jgi:hypothetical protein
MKNIFTVCFYLLLHVPPQPNFSVFNGDNKVAFAFAFDRFVFGILDNGVHEKLLLKDQRNCNGHNKPTHTN